MKKSVPSETVQFFNEHREQLSHDDYSWYLLNIDVCKISRPINDAPTKSELRSEFKTLLFAKTELQHLKKYYKLNDIDIEFIKLYISNIEKQHIIFQKMHDVINALPGLDRTKNWKRLVEKRNTKKTCYCCNEKKSLSCHHIEPTFKLITKNCITTLEEAHNLNRLWNIALGTMICNSCHMRAHSEYPFINHMVGSYKEIKNKEKTKYVHDKMYELEQDLKNDLSISYIVPRTPRHRDMYEYMFRKESQTLIEIGGF